MVIAVHAYRAPLYSNKSMVFSDLYVLTKYPPSGCSSRLSFFIQNLASLFKIGNGCTILTYLIILDFLTNIQSESHLKFRVDYSLKKLSQIDIS